MNLNNSLNIYKKLRVIDHVLESRWARPGGLQNTRRYSWHWVVPLNHCFSFVLQLFHHLVVQNQCYFTGFTTISLCGDPKSLLFQWFYCYLAIWRSKGGGQGTPRAPQGVSRGSPRHPHRAPRDSSGTPRDPHKTPISALRSSPAIGIFVLFEDERLSSLNMLKI